jgi:5-methylcytosine-specific restriction protein A
MSRSSRLTCLKPRLAISNPGGWQPDAVRGNRHQRGYGSTWNKLRDEILTRDQGLCQNCNRNGHTTLATQVDHIKPKAQGGSDDPSNLEAICDPCHKTKTQIESRGGGW